MFPLKKILLFPAVLALCLTTHSKAAILLSVQQVGADVVVTGSGTAITTGLSTFGTGGENAIIAPHADALTVGPSAVQTATNYNGVTGPSNFGSGSITLASSGTGQRFGLDSVGLSLLLDVPAGYISGALLAGTSTYLNATFSSLGITSGTYFYTFGSGATADSLTIQVGPAAGPAPAPEGGATLLLLGGAVANLAILRRFFRTGGSKDCVSA